MSYLDLIVKQAYAQPPMVAALRNVQGRGAVHSSCILSANKNVPEGARQLTDFDDEMRPLTAIFQIYLTAT